MRRRDSVIHPSARIFWPTVTGFRKSTLMRAVTPQLSSCARAHAMTSSMMVHRIPPWMIPSQPSNRSGTWSSAEHRPGSRFNFKCRPISFNSPQAKQLCGRMRRSWYESIAVRTVCPDSAAVVGVDPGATGSDIEVLDLPRLGLDEVLARLDALAHQHREDRVGFRGVVHLRPQEGARLRVHRGVPELIRVHLTEALEPLDRHVLDGHLLDDGVALRFRCGVVGHLAGADPEERRLGDEEITVLDDLRHVPEEEGQKQGS